MSLPNLLPYGTDGSAGLPNLPNLPFLELGSQSNGNSEFSKPTLFRIGTNQTHPRSAMEKDWEDVVRRSTALNYLFRVHWSTETNGLQRQTVGH